MKKIFYIALTIVLGLAGTSCDREKLTYDSKPARKPHRLNRRVKTSRRTRRNFRENRNSRSFFFRCHTQ